MIRSYNLRPGTVDAVMWDGTTETAQEIEVWTGRPQIVTGSASPTLIVHAPEMVLYLNPGDYLVLDSGQFVGCPASIFERDYAPANEEEEAT